MKKLLLLLVACIIFGCGREESSLPQGFVYVDEEIPEAVIDLRYFSRDNFIGDTIRGYEGDRLVISEEAARALQKIQRDLSQLDLRLKIFDGYRPQVAVDHFVEWAKDPEDTMMKVYYYPEVPKEKLFDEGYISARSGHTRGSTLDLTLVDKDGKELDMGSPWDHFSPRSWVSYGKLTMLQVSNRMLLQTIMVQYGFQPYAQEWWHFTLKDEPFPDTYFNFPIK